MEQRRNAEVSLVDLMWWGSGCACREPGREVPRAWFLDADGQHGRESWIEGDILTRMSATL
jgi:hypothetical protein